MDFFKSYTWIMLICLIGAMGSSISVHADSNAEQTLNLFSDEQLSNVYAQGSANALSYFEQLVLDSNQKSDQIKLVSKPNESSKLSMNSISLSEMNALTLVQALHAYQAKVSLQGKQIMIQVKEIHIPIVEVDMNMQGLYQILDPIGLSTQFVTSSLYR